MGEVLLARDTELGRKVAIKFLNAGSADQTGISRFRQEARAASELNHPNILTVYDVGVWEGSPYIVSELLEGEPLREVVQRGALPLVKVIDHALQVARGLAATHEKGIIHRDLKPENIFVTKDGRVKILDFGLAKLQRVMVAGEVNTEVPTNRLLHTESGMIVGTTQYMSPEQTRCEPVDHRSDIFSFGAVLYEMVTGAPAFQRGSAVETMHAILKEDPAEVSNIEHDSRVERLIRHCLEKRPEARFQSASDLCFALEMLSHRSALRTNREGLVTTAGQKKTGKTRIFEDARLAWLTVVALLLVVLGLAWAYFKRNGTAEVRMTKLALMAPSNTSFDRMALSPDGQRLAFTAATGAKVQLWVRSLDSTEAYALAGTDGASHPFWSPDSRVVAFFSGSKLKKIDASGGPAATLCDVGIGTGGTWNADVILFSSLGGAGVSRLSASGGPVTSVVKPDLKLQETDYSNPYFLPDGRHFLYNVVGGQKEARGIYVASLDGNVKKRLLDADSNALYAPTTSGEGCLLFGNEGVLLAQPFDPINLKLNGEPLPIADQVGRVLDGTALGISRRNVSASDNGVLVYDPIPSRQHRKLIWVERSGKLIASLDRIDNVNIVSLAPDEKKFIASLLDIPRSSNNLWLSDVKGENVTRFTFDSAHDMYPIWDYDQTRIVWSSNRDGIYQLYEKAVSGSGEDTPILKSDYFKFPTDWSRDGRFIIYRQIDPKTKYDIWVLPIGSPDGDLKPFPFLHSEANEAAAVLSPNGQWLAYTSDESGSYEVYVENFPKGGGKHQISTNGGIGPRWRGDGKELYYRARDGKLMSVAVKSGPTFEAAAPVALFEFRAGGDLITPYFSVTRDGQKFLLSTIIDSNPTAPLLVITNWTAELKRQQVR